jgi:hypothetical protein
MLPGLSDVPRDGRTTTIDEMDQAIKVLAQALLHEHTVVL